jgi:hypothetical protein
VPLILPVRVLSTDTTETVLDNEAAQTQWPNTKYDDNSGTLATLAAGKYGVVWFYLESDGDLVMLYGRNEHASSAAAEADTEP